VPGVEVIVWALDELGGMTVTGGDEVEVGAWGGTDGSDSAEVDDNDSEDEVEAGPWGGPDGPGSPEVDDSNNVDDVVDCE
jgi:hypothetical protein